MYGTTELNGTPMHNGMPMHNQAAGISINTMQVLAYSQQLDQQVTYFEVSIKSQYGSRLHDSWTL